MPFSITNYTNVYNLVDKGCEDYII